ncbi:hypothetical protein HAX54_006440 [Datura stramonium]|uniref:Uncharacterized protein n=1 Tax=Datura stramonium TaxID=4076 RepID=A0ABS8WW46_DATST|nr:hypothetical protein [Datura stramonium]
MFPMVNWASSDPIIYIRVEIFRIGATIKWCRGCLTLGGRSSRPRMCVTMGNGWLTPCAGGKRGKATLGQYGWESRWWLVFGLSATNGGVGGGWEILCRKSEAQLAIPFSHASRAIKKVESCKSWPVDKGRLLRFSCDQRDIDHPMSLRSALKCKSSLGVMKHLTPSPQPTKPLLEVLLELQIDRTLTGTPE